MNEKRELILNDEEWADLYQVVETIDSLSQGQSSIPDALSVRFGIVTIEQTQEDGFTRIIVEPKK